MTHTEQQEKSVELRLQESAAKCLSCLDAWKKDNSGDEERESLMDAVHELRRVTSRIEIDIAMAERVNTNAKCIPIPEHKSKMEKKKDQKPLSEILPVAEIKKSIKKKIEIEVQDEADKEDTNSAESVNTSNPTDTAQEEKQTPKRRTRRKKEDTEKNTEE